MRLISTLMLLMFFCSCKKTTTSIPPEYQYTDTSHILQEVNFRTNVIKQSAYDSAHNITFDTINIAYIRIVGEPYSLENLNTVMTISPSFSFLIRSLTSTSTDPDFILTSGFLPDLSSVTLNTAYENTYSGTFYTCPVFISCHQGAGPASWRYFLSQDQIPTDGTAEPTAKAYCKVIITKKYDVHWKQDVFTILDGSFSGYYEGYFDKGGSSKYMQRLEFTCSFKGVKVAS